MSKKGKAKNTINKAKHTKLMDQKVNKIKLEKKQTNRKQINPKEIINHFNLLEHPKSSCFKGIYRSKRRILEKNLLKYIKGNRNYCTSIYFLLTSNKFSAFHKVNQDEIWHFYKGSTLKLHLISSDGKYSSVLIGSNFKKRRSISVYCS